MTGIAMTGIAGPGPTLSALNLAEKLVPDWRIVFEAKRPGDTNFVVDANVVIDREKRSARLQYNAELDDETLGFLFKHELVHVLLADMDFVACNGRSVEIMEIFNLFEERVANILARNL